MTGEHVLANARIVLRDEVLAGTVHIADGTIAAVERTPTQLPGAVDCDGDYLIPGLIEIHTDNMEKHLVPRPKLFWPVPLASVLAHDTQIVGSGITTVLRRHCGRRIRQGEPAPAHLERRRGGD